MAGAATLMMPDGGSTRPGATASQGLSLCCADAAVVARVPPYIPCVINAAVAARVKRPRTAATAMLRFDMLMRSKSTLKISAAPHRILHERSGRLRYG